MTADASASGDQDRFTGWLRESAEPDWSRAVDHRFVRELAADDLDDAVFRRYLLQDYAFVGTLADVVGYAAGQAPTMAAKARLAGFLGTLSGDEDDYFGRAFDALSVPETARADPEPTPTTEAFCDLLLRGALEGGYAETLAVLLPVEWSYLSWASARVDADPARPYFAEWIDLHAEPGFAAFVGWLRAELDESALRWLDAAVVLAESDPKYPPLLGTGGNDRTVRLHQLFSAPPG